MIAGKPPFSSQDKISLLDTTLPHLLEKTKLVQFKHAKMLLKVLPFILYTLEVTLRTALTLHYFYAFKIGKYKTNWLRHSLKCLPLRGQILLSHSVNHIV